MRYRLSAMAGGAALALTIVVAGAAGASAAGSPATGGALLAATPGPTVTCPPAIPLTGAVTGVTTTSLTISYSIFQRPPCGYDPPVTVTLFASSEDARQWLNPVAEAVSGPERSGKVTIDGLTPDTAYWYRFSANGQHDPYWTGSGRTAAEQPCAATVAIDSAWGGGFVARVTVRNAGAETLGTWHVSWRWPGDERIVSLWNGVAADAGDGVTIGNASYNGTLAPGASTTFGMLVAATAPPVGLDPACTR
ncbi:cellulose binding domain-containing protein [Actinoplanes sp. NPDC048988]|uniref:cellulose binding domain-containing protein n=1 Tax=Actinoplanes sp. NPDC048988 TaxID=3363901 RepID=UPI0037232595